MPKNPTKPFNSSFLSVLHFLIYITLVLYLVFSFIMAIETKKPVMLVQLIFATITSWRLWFVLHKRVPDLWDQDNPLRAYLRSSIASLAFLIINYLALGIAWGMAGS